MRRHVPVLLVTLACSSRATGRQPLVPGVPDDVDSHAAVYDSYEVQIDCRPFHGAPDTDNVRRPWAVIGRSDAPPVTQEELERLRSDVVEPIARLIDPDSGVGYGPICTKMGIDIRLNSWHDVDRTISLLGSIERLLPYRVEVGIEVGGL